MKLLVKGGMEYNLLEDYDWEVTEIERHVYYLDGVHPVARRITKTIKAIV